jgi:hypothetical protein
MVNPSATNSLYSLRASDGHPEAVVVRSIFIIYLILSIIFSAIFDIKQYNVIVYAGKRLANLTIKSPDE